MEVEKIHLWIKWCTWYKRVNHELTNLKGIVSAYDNALFLWHDATGNLMGILTMHKVDFVFYENDLFQKNVISELKNIESGTFTIDQNLDVSFNRYKERSLRKKKMMNWAKRRQN